MYLIYKNDKTFKTETTLVLKGGYSFNQKLPITLFNAELINYVLNKKLTNSLKGIINLYLLYEDDEEGAENRANDLIPKIELLRSILIDNYAAFLSEGEIESYLTKMEKLEDKICRGITKKSRGL